MKLVSIIIPAHNAESYITKCLDSASNQNYHNIEVIAIDDGSTDNTLKIMQNYAKDKQNVRVLSIDPSGVSVVRNLGIKEAKGDYICFVDSDDYIDNNLIKNLEQYINEDYDLIKYKLIRVDNKGKEIEKVNGPVFKEKTGEEAFNTLYSDDTMLQPPVLYLYNKMFLMKTKLTYPEGKVHEDFARTALIMLKAHKVCSIDLFGYYYVQTDKSITRGNEEERKYKRAMDMIEHYDYMVENIGDYNLDNKTVQNVKIYYTNCIILEINNLSDKYQKKYLTEIKKRKMFKNIKARNIKQIIKKVLLNINVNLYLKLR